VKREPIFIPALFFERARRFFCNGVPVDGLLLIAGPDRAHIAVSDFDVNQTSITN